MSVFTGLFCFVQYIWIKLLKMRVSSDVPELSQIDQILD